MLNVSQSSLHRSPLLHFSWFTWKDWVLSRAEVCRRNWFSPFSAIIPNPRGLYEGWDLAELKWFIIFINPKASVILGSRKSTMNMLKSCYSHWNSPREVLKCCWETNPKTDSHLPAAFASVGSKWWDLHHDFDSRCPTSLTKIIVNHGKSINSFHCWL